MGTRGQKPPVLLLVVAVLILFLPLLAYLQYDWLGKVSEREREQMQAALRRTLSQFTQDFDREIARIFFQFQDRRDAANPGAADYEKLLAHWNATAPYPQLVRDLFLEQPAAGVQLQRLDSGSSSWQAADWIREFGPQRELGNPIDPRIPALVIPIFVVSRDLPPQRAVIRSTGRLLVRLNLDYIQKEFLPRLVRSYFLGTAAEFRIQIAASDDGASIIYSSDSAGPIQGAGDASGNVLTLRMDQFHSLMPAEIPFVAATAPVGMRADRVFSLQIEPPLEPPQAHAVVGEAFFNQSSWKVIAVHRAGSLDAAVAQVRRRNLLISFGILAVLAASTGIVLVSTARAQRLARQQMEFVSAVSHELRTPLAVICSAGENLADGVVRDTEQLERYGKVVRDEGRRLTEMVEQVLSFSGLQAGLKKQAFVPVELAEIVDRVLDALAIPIREMGFIVERHIPPDIAPVLADPAALTRAVYNLVTNAIRYSGDERWLRISISAEGHWLKLSVDDRGPGIPSTDLPHIFEPFYRGRPAIEGQIPGSGLGLSLVKQTVDQHGGRISVASNAGAGSSFCIALPIGQPLEVS
jgi:signal transduction histidine kinase